MDDSKRVLKNAQRNVLNSLAINGADYGHSISTKFNFTSTRTRNILKRLEKLGLIWLSKGSKDVKSKSPKFYSPTPYGIVEAFLSINNEKEIVQVIKTWKPYTPHYIINYQKFKQNGILKDLKQVLNDLYPVLVKPWGGDKYERNLTFTKEQDCIIHSHILDSTLFFQIFEWSSRDIDEDIKRKFLEIVVQDPEFKISWENWLAAKKLIINSLERMYNNLKKKSEDN